MPYQKTYRTVLDQYIVFLCVQDVCVPAVHGAVPEDVPTYCEGGGPDSLWPLELEVMCPNNVSHWSGQSLNVSHWSGQSHSVSHWSGQSHNVSHWSGQSHNVSHWSGQSVCDLRNQQASPFLLLLCLFVCLCSEVLSTTRISITDSTATIKHAYNSIN